MKNHDTGTFRSLRRFNFRLWTGKEGSQVPFSVRALWCSMLSWEECGGWMSAEWFTTP